MNRNILKCASTLAILLIGMQTSQAASINATADAVVLAPITIIPQGDNMDFGSVADDGDGSTVVLAQDGTVTAGGGAIIVAATGAAAGGALVSGDANLAYTLTAIADTVLTGAGGPDMNVTAFNTNSTGALTGGSEILNIGATLTLNSGQGAGSYTGTYAVVVNY